MMRSCLRSSGKRDPEKERLVRLLISRMTWDWETYEKLKHGRENRELELQCCMIDTCHYTFPGNLDRLLEGIAELKPVRESARSTGINKSMVIRMSA
jgi:hypothetical protein